MKVQYTVAVIVFVAAIATLIGLTATNTFAFPNIPILQQEQVKQTPQSIQTIETDKDTETEDNEVDEETEANDDADEQDQVDPQQASQTKITAEEAKEIAIKHVGAQLSDVREVELESEGGKLIYSVEIVKDGNLVEVEIDAATGNVITVEHGDD